MKKIGSLLLIFLLTLSLLVAAHGEETFAQAEEIIGQKIPCSELSNGELELIGDYYMEQLHPGEAHVVMDEMMGGEGSEQLEQTHIALARNFYCGEHEALSSGMMNTIMGRNGRMMSGGMMGYYSSGYAWMPILTPLLYIIIILASVAFIIWLVYDKLIKKEKRNKTKKR